MSDALAKARALVDLSTLTPDNERIDEYTARLRRDGIPIAKALIEAVEVIKAMVNRADVMGKTANDHPENLGATLRTIGAERVAHSGREFLARIGVRNGE